MCYDTDKCFCTEDYIGDNCETAVGKYPEQQNCIVYELYTPFFFFKLTENSLYNDERYFGKVHVETIPFQLEYEVYQNENI